MNAGRPIRLTRRGELLRAVSHAIRCLNQVSPTDIETWDRDASRFRNRIRARYADVMEHLPPEFEMWIEERSAGVYSDQQQQQMKNLLDRLSTEILQRERLA